MVPTASVVLDPQVFGTLLTHYCRRAPPLVVAIRGYCDKLKNLDVQVVVDPQRTLGRDEISKARTRTFYGKFRLSKTMRHTGSWEDVATT